MADNMKYDLASGVISLTKASVSSGEVGEIQDLVYFAETDSNSSNSFQARFGVFVAEVPVKGETTTNAAIAIGDNLYWDEAAGLVNADNTNGKLCGKALAAVSSGATTTIEVLFNIPA